MGVRLPYDLTPQDVAGAAEVALRVFRALSVHNADPPALHVYWIERMEERWLRGTLLGNHCRMVQMECTSDKNLALRTPFHSSWLLHVVASAIQYLKGSRKQNLKVYTCTLEWQSSRSAMMVGNTKTIETIKVDEFRPKNRQKKSAASSGKPTSDDEAEELLATPTDGLDTAAVDEDDWVKAIGAALGITLDDEDLTTTTEEEERAKAADLISEQSLVVRQDAETVWRHHAQQSIETFRWAHSAFQRAFAITHVQNRKSSILNWSNLQSMPMAMLQHPTSHSVEVYSWFGEVQWCMSTGVVSTGWAWKMREKSGRFVYPTYMWDKKVDTSGYKVIMPDIGVVLSKSGPIGRDIVPVQCKHISQSWMLASLAASELSSLSEGCFLCDDPNGIMRTCAMCKCTAHEQCLASCSFEIQCVQDGVDVLPTMFDISNMCILCCKLSGHE